MKTKYRAVLLVPSIVEFENEGTDKHVTEQINRIAGGMGKCFSNHPRQPDTIYEAKVVECVKVQGRESKTAAA